MVLLQPGFERKKTGFKVTNSYTLIWDELNKWLFEMNLNESSQSFVS